MKKTPIIIMCTAMCVDLLFAQEIIISPEAPEGDSPAVIVDSAMPEPVAVEMDSVVPETVSVELDSAVEIGADAVEPEPVVLEDVEAVDAVDEGSMIVVADATEDVAPAKEVAAEESKGSIEVGLVDDMTAGVDVRGGLISLSLKDVELQDVVRLFSRLSNANIIVPDLKDDEEPKRVDVNLDNVEWKPALQAILDTHGLELVEKIPGSEVYSIRPRAADAPDPMEIKVFKLNYATVDEVVKMVNTLVQKDGGQISTYPARNSIVVQGSAKVINDFERIVAAVDFPREQVFIEAKFLELSDSASEQLGIDWNVLGGYQVGAGAIGGSYSYDESRADNENRFVDIAGNPYESLETKPTSNTENSGNEDENGIDYPARPGNDFGLDRIYGIVPTMESIDSALVGRTLGATLTASDFNLVLSALKEMNGARVVSNPKIIVANEETATIHIGAKKPNIKGVTQTAGDSQSTTVYSLDEAEPYFEDGVRVDVTPTVNTEDNITVRIQPTLDRLDAEPTYAPDGTEFWGKSTKTINTVFSLEDRQTAAIGGLTEATRSDVERKVPVLGSIPYLGRLFSYNSESSRQVETIIFVTVGMANPASMQFETGLPEDSTLAMRHRAESATERALQQEELKILETAEAERLQDQLDALRKAEQARLAERNAAKTEQAMEEILGAQQ